MSRKRSGSFPRCIQVLFQGMFDFLAKIDDHFISTFSDDRNPVIFKINILDIKSHTF